MPIRHTAQAQIPAFQGPKAPAIPTAPSVALLRHSCQPWTFRRCRHRPWHRALGPRTRCTTRRTWCGSSAIKGQAGATSGTAGPPPQGHGTGPAFVIMMWLRPWPLGQLFPPGRARPWPLARLLAHRSRCRRSSRCPWPSSSPGSRPHSRSLTWSTSRP